jgi:O-methyltransferase involved in polyketide biosynthesis
MYRINLGCERQVIDGWENLDPRFEKFVGAKYWEWNKPIPFANDSAELIVVQHVLMYCPKESYDWNLKEIYRVLGKGGKFLLKEENNLVHQWRKVGTHHKTGFICSSTNPEEITPYLINNGFSNIVNNTKLLVDKYGSKIINRQRKLFRGMMFVIECEKS